LLAPEEELALCVVAVYHSHSPEGKPLVLPFTWPLRDGTEILLVWDTEEEAQTFIDSPEFEAAAIPKRIPNRAKIVDLLKELSNHMNVKYVIAGTPPAHEWPEDSKIPPGAPCEVDWMVEALDTRTGPDPLEDLL